MAATKAKWQMVYYHLKKFAETGGQEHITQAFVWCDKWKTSRGRPQTNLSVTVRNAIRKYTTSGTWASRRSSANAIAEMVAREAKLRVVARVQSVYRERNHKTAPERLVREALATAIRQTFREMMKKS